jgi:hypothetical protein
MIGKIKTLPEKNSMEKRVFGTHLRGYFMAWGRIL